MSIEGFGGIIGTSDDARTNHDSGLGAGDFIADSDFSGGYAAQESTGQSHVFGILSSRPTLVSGDELNLIFQYSIEAVSISADMAIAIIGAANLGAGFRATEPYCELFLKSTGAVYLKITAGGSSTSSSTVGSFFTAGTPKWIRIRFKRTGASTCEAELYVGTEALETWTTNASVTHAAWTSNPIQLYRIGLIDSFAKGDSLTWRCGLHSIGLNETPVMAGRVAYMLPDGDGGTLEWTSTAGTHYTEVDDAFGSESSAEYIESGTAAADKTDELACAAMPSSTAVHCVGVAHGTIVATAGSHLKVLMKLSGVESAEMDLTAWDGGTSAVQMVPFPADPSGGAWSEADVNGATIMFRRKAASATNWRIRSAAMAVFYTPAAAATRRIFIC